MIAISITDIITISLTLFAIIDVLGNVPVIISMKNKGIVLQPVKTTIFAGVLMVTFLFLGDTILSLLGLDTQSFALAFPLLVGAGTLTVLISMRSVYSIYDILIAVLINSIIMYFVLRSTTWIELKIGKTALHAITKFFGVIALALAIKIFMTNF